MERAIRIAAAHAVKPLMKILGIMLLSMTAAAAEEKPLEFGVFPYLSAQQIVRDFLPLRNLIAETTGKTVNMSSTPDYPSFYQKTRDGGFDVVFTAPHLGRIAEKESRYKILVKSGYKVSNAIVVMKDSQIKSISDIRGKTVAMPTPWAFVYQTGREYLHEQGLEADRDYKLRIVNINPDTLFAILHGEADVAISGIKRWQKHPENGRMRLLAETEAQEGFLILAHPRVPAATLNKLREALLNYGKTEAGKAYFAKTGHVSFLPVDENSLKQLDPYTRIPEGAK